MVPGPLSAARDVFKLMLDRDDPNRNGSAYAITTIAPISAGATPALRDTLHAYRRRADSPLAAVPNLHFARWVIIDGLYSDYPRGPKYPPVLLSDYLLFSADVTVPHPGRDDVREAFFRDLAIHMPIEAEQVWGSCENCPKPAQTDEFVDYLRAGEVEAALYFAATPNVSPDEIRRAVHLRNTLSQFAVEHVAADDDELLTAFRASRLWQNLS